MEKSILFTPYELSGLTLNNRMVMAPMTRSRSNNEGNVATALTATYYEQRATAGLIITEGTFISKKAVGFINVPGIYSDDQVAGWKLVTDAVHAKGGKIFAQIWHVGRMSHPDLHNGELPLAPSAINPHAKAFTNNGFVDTVEPAAMTTQDIQQTIRDFTQAAANAVKAGFDGVELHGANGYAQGMLVDELTIPTHEYIVKELNSYGLAYLHLTEPFVPVDDVPHAVTKVAKHFRPLYKGTLIINKGFDKAKAIQVLEDGDADLVAFGVPFIANPDLVKRYETDAPLNTPDQATFYVPGAKGYTDYPFLSE